jgi:hypothetical protein
VRFFLARRTYAPNTFASVSESVSTATATPISEKKNLTADQKTQKKKLQTKVCQCAWKPTSGTLGVTLKPLIISGQDGRIDAVMI